MNGLVRQEYSYLFQVTKNQNPPTRTLKCIRDFTGDMVARLCTSTVGGRSLAGELRAHMTSGRAKQAKNKMHYVCDSQIVVFSIFLMGHQTDPQMEVILSVLRTKKGNNFMYFYFYAHANVGAIS